MNNTNHEPARINDIRAARLLLSKFGLTAEDLFAEPSRERSTPTVAEYVERVSAAVGVGARTAYRPYWNRAVREWGNRALDDISTLEVSQLAEQSKTEALVRRNSRGGRLAAEHTISALRCLYNCAVAEGILSAVDNPAARASKPRRLPSTRSALPVIRLDEINRTAASTGNDPSLDALILRLHTETACRRGGALALTAGDLDAEQRLVRLHEKGGTQRWQPVSPTLMNHLLLHNEQRGDSSADKLLRYTNGRPITARRYDYLWNRLGRYLPWVAIQQVSTHWLRHTTLTWVERNFGYAVATAYAGHVNGSHSGNATAIYVRASLQDIATALAALTGEPHPLARDISQ